MKTICMLITLTGISLAFPASAEDHDFLDMSRTRAACVIGLREHILPTAPPGDSTAKFMSELAEGAAMTGAFYATMSMQEYIADTPDIVASAKARSEQTFESARSYLNAFDDWSVKSDMIMERCMLHMGNQKETLDLMRKKGTFDNSVQTEEAETYRWALGVSWPYWKELGN
jgi:hypothetical protein